MPLAREQNAAKLAALMGRGAARRVGSRGAVLSDIARKQQFSSGYGGGCASTFPAQQTIDGRDRGLAARCWA